jgi:glycosyltransferase involved in cell wall biosynthesis
MVRVLHLSLSDLEGGAAKAAFGTHVALREAGHDSRMLVRSKVSDDPWVEAVAPLPPWESRRRRLLRRLPLPRPSFPEPTQTFNFDVEQDFDERSLFRQDADVLCIQRITRFLTVRQIRALHEHYRRPLLWVLHDQFPVTGGCHFSLGCSGFTERCGRCPQLRSDDPDDPSRELWLRKQRELLGLPLTFVAPSSEAERWVRESSLFGEHPVARIPQPIDVDVFRPAPQSSAREILRLPSEASVILLGAPDAAVERKGGRYALEALARLAERLPRDDVFLLVLGWNGEELLAQAPFPGQALDRLHDEVAMALVYQASDVFLSPSIGDSGPMMVPESLLCGRPIVAFRVGCAPDLLTRPEHGALAEPRDSDGLAEGLLDVLGRGRDEAACREAALGYEPSRVAAAYAELCESVSAGPG